MPGRVGADDFAEQALARLGRRSVWPRPDQRHVSGNRIEQLRQFVEAAPAQECSHASDAGVGCGGLTNVIGVATINGHATELEDSEASVVEPFTLLREEYGPRTVQLDGDRNCRKHGRKCDYESPREHLILDPLEPLIQAGDWAVK